MNNEKKSDKTKCKGFNSEIRSKSAMHMHTYADRRMDLKKQGVGDMENIYMNKSDGERERLKPAAEKKTNTKVSLTGLYATLGLSIAMIGAAGYFAYNQTTNELDTQLDSIAQRTGTAPVTTITEKRVDAAAADVPKETTVSYTQITTPSETTVTTTEIKPEQTTPHIPTAVSQNYVFPVGGEVILPFSGGELIKSITTGVWQTHNGVDFAAVEGEKVKAMSGGRVSEVVNDALWGYCVIIEHGNGVSSRYCSLNESIGVSLGDEVEVGEVIGSVGKSADIESAQPVHLHFEVKENGSFINPVEFIEANAPKR